MKKKLISITLIVTLVLALSFNVFGQNIDEDDIPRVFIVIEHNIEE